MTPKAQTTKEKSASRIANLKASAQQEKQSTKRKGNLQNVRKFLETIYWIRD